MQISGSRAEGFMLNHFTVPLGIHHSIDCLLERPRVSYGKASPASDSRYESPNREVVIPSNTTSNCILSCHGSNPPPSSPTPPVHPPFSGLSSDIVLCLFSLFFAFFVTARKGRGKWPRVGGEKLPVA